jgi:hypothetical protein
MASVEDESEKPSRKTHSRKTERPESSRQGEERELRREHQHSHNHSSRARVDRESGQYGYDRERRHERRERQEEDHRVKSNTRPESRRPVVAVKSTKPIELVGYVFIGWIGTMYIWDFQRH